MALPPSTAAASLVPSADEVIADQFVRGAPVWLQFTPQLVEVYIPAIRPFTFAAAASLFPSAEDAIDCQEFDGAVVKLQLIPPSEDEKIGAPLAPKTADAAATILMPSAEQATALQDTLLEATARNQVTPELVETNIEPSAGGLVNAEVTATSRVPSADEAIDFQLPLVGAVLQVQFCAHAGIPLPSKHPKAVIMENKRLCFIVCLRLRHQLHSLGLLPPSAWRCLCSATSL